MAYNPRITAPFKDFKNLGLWELNIVQKDYAGAEEEITKTAPDPFEINYGDSTRDIFRPTIPSDCDFSFWANARFQYEDLVASDALKNRVEILYKGAIFWKGYVITDLYAEPLELLNEPITFQAADLKLLENFSVTLLDQNSPFQYVTHLLNKLDFGYGFRIAVNITDEFEFFNKFTTTLVQAITFDGLNGLEALKKIMLSFGAQVRQYGGRWEIVQVPEKQFNYNYTDYDETGTQTGTGVFSNVVATTPATPQLANNFCTLMPGGEIQKMAPLKEFTVKTELQANNGLILNGDFELFHFPPSVVLNPPLNYFDYWTNNTQVAQIEKEGTKYALIYPIPTAGFDLYIAQSLHTIYGPIIAGPGRIKFTLKFALLANDNLHSNADTSGFVQIIAGDKYLFYNEDLNEYLWTDQKSRIALYRNIRGESINELSFKTFEATAEIITGPYEVRLMGSFYPNFPPSEFELVGSMFGDVVVNLVNADGTDPDDEVSTLTQINANNNFIPDDIGLLFDIPEDSTLINQFEKYSNLLFPGDKMLYNGNIGTLAQILANQIEAAYATIPLYLKATVVSDIFNITSVLTDSEFPTRRFVPMLARFNPKTLEWILQLISINTEADIIGDFDSADADPEDFDT